MEVDHYKNIKWKLTIMLWYANFAQIDTFYTKQNKDTTLQKIKMKTLINKTKL